MKLELGTTKMEKLNWKPWNKEAYRTIKPGRYHVKLDDGTITYDDFKNRTFGYGFSFYVERHIVEYAEW